MDDIATMGIHMKAVLVGPYGARWQQTFLRSQRKAKEEKNNRKKGKS